MSYIDQYRSKLVSAAEAVRIVKNGDWIDWGFGHTVPHALDAALAARKNELQDIKIRSTLSLKIHEVWRQDPKGKPLPSTAGISAVRTADTTIRASPATFP